jgi:hypothetical protein
LLDEDGAGVAAVRTDPALTVVVAPPDDDDVEDAGVVAALAIARLPPSPTPSAPAPIAVARIILPSLVFNVSVSLRWRHGVMGSCPTLRTPAPTTAFMQ